MFRFISGMIVAAATLVAAAVWADDAAVATLAGKGAVLSEKGGEVSLTVEMTRPVGWRLWMADDPPRVVVELSEFAWSKTPNLRSTSIAALEIVETGPNLSELHAVLREPLGVLSAEMIAAEDGTAVLNVRLQPTTADVFQSDLEADLAKNSADTKRLVIALDPGHGGSDPGAEAGALREADLVLNFCKRLRDILLASGKFGVVLTRSDDQLLSLDARLTRAREAEADVLLSFHADALVDADAASGIVLYRLSDDARAAANLRLRERHSGDDLLNGLDLTNAGEDVTVALLDLASLDTTPRTEALSTALLNAMVGADLLVNTRPEREGEFAVLKAADIPSLLIELGFLSTEADLARLTSKEWQTAAAKAIRDGLLLWAEEDALR